MALRLTRPDVSSPALAAWTRPCAKCRRIASAMIDTAVFVRQMNSTSGGSLFAVGSRSVICGNAAYGVVHVMSAKAVHGVLGLEP